MLYILKTDDYLKILTDEEVKDFVAINFSEYVKSILEKLYSKLSEEQNLRKVVKSLYIPFDWVHHYIVEILNLFDPELQLIKIKPMVKNKFKKLLSELKRLKVQTVLVLGYKKN